MFSTCLYIWGGLDEPRFFKTSRFCNGLAAPIGISTRLVLSDCGYAKFGRDTAGCGGATTAFLPTAPLSYLVLAVGILAASPTLPSTHPQPLRPRADKGVGASIRTLA